MIESNATGSYEAPTYVYGGILYKRVSESDSLPRVARVGFATCLSQGVITSSVLIMILMSIAVLADADVEYGIILGIGLFWGFVVGSVEALIIWLCTRVAGHNLRWFARALIGALILEIPYLYLLYGVLPGFQVHGPTTGYLMVIGIPAAMGATIGLVTGSPLDSWREQTRRALAFLKEEIHYYLID